VKISFIYIFTRIYPQSVRISKGFIKSSLIYTLAGALPMASAIILLPFYIHYLSTDLYGELSVYLVFSLLVQILVTFSFDTSVYIHFHEFKEDRQKLSAFISAAFIFMLLIGAGVGIILTVTGDALFKVLDKQHISFYPYGLASVGAGIFQSVFKVHSSLLQSRERPDIFLWSNTLSFVLIAVFTIAGLKLFPNTLTGPVTGRLLASAIMGAWALGRIFREFGFHTDFTWLRSSLSFNIYTFVYQVLQWVINYFDRILMLFYLLLPDVGVYDFAVKCLVAIELLMNGLHNSFYPKVVSNIMSQTDKGSTPEINRYYHGLTAVVMLMICGSILVFPWAIDTFVHRSDYREVIPYIPYLAMIYIFRAMRLYFAVPYGILKYVKPMPVIYSAVSALKIVLTIVLISEFRIYGVIAASLASAVAEIILLRLNLRGKFHFRFNVFKIVLAPLLLFLLILVLEPVFGETDPVILHSFYMLFCLGILGWVYRNEVKLIDPRKLIK
jgi:O-antigen/teichoic acid export membrane protein